MKYTKILFTIILFATSNNLLAAWSQSTGKVNSVYSHNGAHVIRTSLTDSVCTMGNFWWPTSDPDAKDMFAIALTALSTDKIIKVAYSDSVPDCQHGDSAKITHMIIYK